MMLQSGKYIPDPTSFAIGHPMSWNSFNAIWDFATGRVEPTPEQTFKCFFVGGRNDFEVSEFCEPGPWLRGFDVYREEARAERRRQLEANARERGQVTMPPRESDDEVEEVSATLLPVTSDQRHMLPTPAETSLTADGYDKTDGFVVDDDDEEDVPSDEDVNGPSEWQQALMGLGSGASVSREDRLTSFHTASTASQVQHRDSRLIDDVLRQRTSSTHLYDSPLVDHEARDSRERSPIDDDEDEDQDDDDDATCA